MAATFILVAFFKVPSFAVIISSAALGIGIHLVKKRRAGKKTALMPEDAALQSTKED